MKRKDVVTIAAVFSALGTLVANPAFLHMLRELSCAPWPQKLEALFGLLAMLASLISARLTSTETDN